MERFNEEMKNIKNRCDELLIHLKELNSKYSEEQIKKRKEENREKRKKIQRYLYP